MPSKAVVLLITSFLVVALVCSSVTITLLPYDVFAKHFVTTITCDNVYNAGGEVTGSKCCYSTYDDDGVNLSNYHLYCHNCDRSGFNCGAEYEVRKVGTTGVLAPGNLTNTPPTGNNTSTIAPVSVTKAPPGAIGNATNSPTNNNTGNSIAMTSSDNPPGCSKKVPIPPNCTLNPFNNSASNKGTASLGNIIKAPVTTTQTCPDGSQPDSNGKCPTSNPNTSSPPPSSNNNQPANNPPPSGGSSNSNGGGSGSSNNNNNGGGSSGSSTSSPSK